MDKDLAFSKLTSIEGMIGGTDEESRQFQTLYKRAATFIRSFEWSGAITVSYFGLGVADIIGIFLFELVPVSEAVDRFLWVVVGDIPSAYLVADLAPNPACALRAYSVEMRKWLGAVKSGKSVAEAIPVNVPPTMAWANKLESRLNFLEKNVLDMHRSDLTNNFGH
jgi:hypothetical protein